MLGGIGRSLLNCCEYRILRAMKEMNELAIFTRVATGIGFSNPR